MKTALLVVAWVIGGLIFEAGAWYGRIELRIARMQQQAADEKQRAVDRERAIAGRNLAQAETFIRMCLDPTLRYAYLGDLVVECKAKETKFKTTI